MLHAILGAFTLGFLISCSKDSETEKAKLTPDVPPKPESPVPFLNISPNAYWADLDVDGRVDSQEIFFVPKDADRKKLAQKLIDGNPWAFSPCSQWRPEFLNLSKSQLFAHPLKTRLENQLQSDLEIIKSDREAPELYSKLGEDLKIILQELPHVQFRFPTEEEFKEYATDAGYLGLYNFQNNEIVAPATMPVSLLIHEMDHRVTAHHRTEPWSLPYREKCPGGEIRTVPKAPHLPSPEKARTSFTFSLDFFGSGENQFRYDDRAAWQPLYRGLELGSLACASPEAKASFLANEVRAYQTMGRYLLFRADFKQRDLNAVRGEDIQKRNAARKKLLKGLGEELRGSSLNPVWTYHMMLHYLGTGGDSGKENLTSFVTQYYSQVIKDPGFIDPPDCRK